MTYRHVFVRLDEEGYRTLVRGGEVLTMYGTTTVHLILADIGFPIMVRELERAIEDAGSGNARMEDT